LSQRQEIWHVRGLANRYLGLLPEFDEPWPTFAGTATVFESGYLAHYLSERDKIWQRWGLTNRNLFPELREHWSGGPVISCGDTHQSFTDALSKWFFGNFPMFADIYGVVSIHCVARALGASFLYKCPASRGSSVEEHSL